MRLSADTADDFKVQVEKIIFYEKNVDENASWLSQCVGIADPSATDKGDNDEGLSKKSDSPFCYCLFR